MELFGRSDFQPHTQRSGRIPLVNAADLDCKWGSFLYGFCGQCRHDIALTVHFCGLDAFCTFGFGKRTETLPPMGAPSEAALICLSYESIRRLPGSNGAHPSFPPSPPTSSFCSDFPIPAPPTPTEVNTQRKRRIPPAFIW